MSQQNQQTFWSAEHLARISQSPVSEQEWLGIVATSRLNSLELLAAHGPDGWYGRTSPGILSSNGGRDFGSFLGGLGKLGYGFAYRILDAQHFGVPQRRRRVFVVGHLGDWRASAAVLFEQHCLQGHPAPSRKAGERVAGTFKARANSGGWGQDVDLAAGEYMQPVVCPEVAFGLNKGSMCADRGEDANLIAHSLRADGFDASEDGTGRGTPLTVCGPLTSSDGGFDIDEAAAGHAVATAFHENQRGELSISDTAGSLKVGGGKPGQGYPAVQVQWASGGGKIENESMQALRSGAEHNYQFLRTGMAVRRLTPRECERLQGFPDDYTAIPYCGKIAADGPRYKALGNSWAVPVVRWIGERIKLTEVE